MKNLYLVCSAGGVGNTFVIDWLRKFYRVNDRNDFDKLKHPQEPVLRNDIKKVVYIFSKNPEEQAISLVRRFRSAQAKKLTGKDLPINSVEDLSKFNYDVFNFEGVFKNWWYDERHPYDIAFINYDRLWNFVPQLVDFLDLSPEKQKTFPPKKPRKNSIETIKNNTLLFAHLQNIYKDYKRFLEDIPDFYIKKGN